MIKRTLAFLLCGVVLAPSAALAQQSKAGVVTTLEGNVTARRVALPSPLPLKFRDEVFLQDTVTTGDKSLARMLLGGKAVVTVRERSVLTITELPGRSTIELETGKFALAVAREKMRPGEEIQIRTPNAIAGVRGTVVITEVNRQSAQAGGGGAAVVTSFYVLRGTITAQPLDPATRQPTGTALQVGSMQAYSAAGSAPPKVTSFAQDQVGQITSGLQPSGQKGGAEAGQEQVKGQAIQTALNLLTALTGTGAQVAALMAPPVTTSITPVDTSTTQIAPIVAFNASDAETVKSSSATPAPTTGPKTFTESFSSSSTGPFVSVGSDPITHTGDFLSVQNGVSVSLAGPLAEFVDSNVTATGALFALNGGSLTSSTTSALLSLDPTTISAGTALIAMNGGTVTLAGALLTDVGGTLTMHDQLLQMTGGASLVSTTTGALVQLSGTTVGGAGLLSMTNATMQLAGALLTASSVIRAPGTDGPMFSLTASSLTSTGTSPLIQLVSTGVDNGENVIRLAGGSTLNLAGTLLKSTDSALVASEVTRSFIAVVDGSTIVTTGTSEPLLAFLGSTSGASSVTAARNFFTLAFNSTSTSPSLSLSGPLLTASLTDFRTGNGASNTFTFLFIGDGAQVTSSSTSPFMTFTQSTVDTSGDILTVRRSTAAAPSRLSLAGPLLAATNSTFTHTSLGFASAFGTSASACCSGFFIGQGAELKSTTPQALIQLTGSSVIGNDAQSGGNFFNVADTFTGAPSSELVAASNVALAGPLLQTTNSTITALFNLVRVRRSALSSTSTAPLVDLTGGSVTLGGTDAATGLAAVGNLLNVSSSPSAGEAATPASVTLAGPLARLTGTTFAAGNGNIVSVFNGATLSSTATPALLQLASSTLTGSSLLSVSGLGGAAGTTKASLTLAGPLLTASSSAMSLGSNVVGVFNGSALTSTTSSPLVQLSGGSLTAGTSSTAAALLHVNGGASPALVTLNGGVLGTGSGANLTVPGALLATFNGGRLVVNSSTSPLFAFTGGTHSFGTASGSDRDAALILRGLGTEVVTETVDVLIDSCSEGCLDPDTQLVTRGTRKPVEHTGTLLDASGGTLTTNKVVRLDTALLEATAPILNLSGGANLTVSNDAIDLVQASKVTMSAGSPLVNLTGSTMTVNNGALFAVRLSSFLNVAGNALNLSGGATLTISNGTLLSVSGDSVVKITGALVNFGSGGGTINITNNLCPSGCPTFGPFKVFLGSNASSANVIIGNGAVAGTGTINLSPNGAHISVEGPNTRVNIAPTL